MGCDIHSFAEVKRGDRWEVVGEVHPFDARNYGLFGFLADVRNYSHVPTIAAPKFDIPPDCSKEVREKFDDWSGDAHTATWLTLQQLLEFDYEQAFWDHRVTKQTGPNSWDGAALADEGEGEHPILREFLGEYFFRDIDVLNTLGDPEDVRVIFWFDN